MRLYILGLLTLLFGMMTGACSDDVKEHFAEGQRTVQTRLAGYVVGGNDATLSEENVITDVKACLFEDGVLVKVYDNLTGNSGVYDFIVDSNYGNLYVVANTEDLLDWSNMVAGQITENEWKSLTVSMQGDKASMFFTGGVVLEKQPANAPVEMILKRGLARVDVTMEMDGILVNSLTLKNVSETGYLLPQESVKSPEGAKRDIAAAWTEPLDKDTEGVMYMYEQQNSDLTVELNVTVAGMERTLTARLPQTIKRNAVYTLNLGGDGSNLNLRVSVDEWDYADDTVVSPDFGDKITVDVDRSELPEGVTLGTSDNQLVMDYRPNEFVLALDCNDQLEVNSVSQLPLEITAFPEGKNLFLVKKRLMAVGYEQMEGSVTFKRKGLSNAYREDVVTLVLTANPTQIEGNLHFDENNYLCDLGDYVDGEYAVFRLAQGKKITVEFDNGEDEWMAVREKSDEAGAYRILGGWKPNDPKADGREQKARIVICDADTEANREEYTVVRRNYGLPVVEMNGVWWCKYNARGNSRNFADQVLSSDDPAQKAGQSSVLDYLASCSNDDFVSLWGWAYQGGSGNGLKVYVDNGVAKLNGYNRGETVNIADLGAKALSPNGYQLPGTAEYEKIFKWGMVVNWKNGEYYTINGVRIHIHSIERDNVMVDGVEMPQLNCFKVYTESCPEGITFYGPGGQWSAGGINHNKLFIGVVNSGWFVNNNSLSTTKGSAADSRILRFMKTPVEYMYE